jgi:hypothetical protein
MHSSPTISISIKRAIPTAVVLTCLRNPIDRAISGYYYQQIPRLRIQTIAAQLGTGVAAQVLDDIRRLNDRGKSC